MNSLEDERIKEYVLVNLCFVISKDEVDRLLKMAKSRFRSKTRVNKIMLKKVDEVAKETLIILKQVLEEHKYEINPAKVDTSLKVHVQDDYPAPDVKTNKQNTVANDNTDTQKVTNSGEADQNPMVINIKSEKVVEDVGDGNGEDAKKVKIQRRPRGRRMEIRLNRFQWQDTLWKKGNGLS